MPNAPYWPTTDDGLLLWLANFSALLTAAPTDYGLVAGDAVIVAAQNTAWIAAKALVDDPDTRTPSNVAAKDAVRVNVEEVVQPYAQLISINPAVLNGDKVAIGVTVRITTRTRVDLTTTDIEVTVTGEGVSLVNYRIVDPATPTTAARPYGARGARVELRIRNAADTEDAITLTGFASRNKMVFAYDPIYKLRRKYMRAQWVGALLIGGAPNNGPYSAWVEV